MNAVQAAVADWLQIVRGEFQEIPGLNLTEPQVQRMWGLDALTSEALLHALVDVHFLSRTHDGAYVKSAS